MSLGLVGQKLGMSRVFTEDGQSIPVTVVQVDTNHVTQVKTSDSDGYNAIQVTVGKRRPNRVSKAMAGHYAKAGVEAGLGVWEFRISDNPKTELESGAELNVDLFREGQKVDVRGTSIGKGFAGVIKRWGFSGLRATHGVSLAHRSAGSIGQCQDPGRVFKGKKMAGHMGAVQRCQQNLEVIRVDNDRKLLLIKGSVPGAKGSHVVIEPSIKADDVVKTEQAGD